MTTGCTQRFRVARYLSTVGVMFFACCAGSAPTDERSAWDQSVERHVGDPLRAAIASGRNSAGVLVAVRDGAIRIAEGFGLESPTGTKVTASDSRFVLNSISKAFVAVSLAQLKARGRIENYDDPANKYLRTYQLPNSRGNEITLKQLFTHTAGIDEAVFGMETDRPILGAPRTAHYVEHQPRYFIAPGLMPVYSELGIDLLGLVIADTAKAPYANYLATEILAPLGMTKTTVGYPTDRAIPHLVTAYQPGVPKNVEPLIYSTPLTLPDGGVISTGEDMGRFMVALTGGAYADVFQIQQTLDPLSIAYGIVFEITHIRGQLVAYHRGGGRGTDCIVAIALAAHSGIFECATTMKPVRGTPANREPVQHEALDLAVFDSLVPAAPDPAEASASTSFNSSAAKPTDNDSWDAYVGDYVGTSRHHFGIGRLRSLLHPYGVIVRRGATGLQLDDVDGFHESSVGHFSSPNALETFTFLKSPVDGRILLSRSLDGTPFEKPRPLDDPRLVQTLLTAFVSIAATGLFALLWPGAARPSAARPSAARPHPQRDMVARVAAVGFALCALGGVGVLYGFHMFGVRYSIGSAWPVWIVRACGFLIIPIAGVLNFACLKDNPMNSTQGALLDRAYRVHLAVLALDALAGIALLMSVGVIGFITQ